MSDRFRENVLLIAVLALAVTNYVTKGRLEDAHSKYEKAMSEIEACHMEKEAMRITDTIMGVRR